MTDTRRGAPSCHATPGPVAVASGTPVVALAGSPNVGKSSLFNAVTGARRTVGNWPGTTVEVGQGRWALDPARAGREVLLIDLPGTYSLDPLSPDEQLTRDLLVGQGADGRPDLVVVVASAADLARTMYLVRQVRELPTRVVVALTMLDLAARRGAQVDVAALSELTGVPVVPLDPRRRDVEALASEVAAALAAPPPAPLTDRPAPGAAPAGSEAAGAVAADDDLALADHRFAWVATAVERATRRSGPSPRTWSDRLDAVTTAPVGGPVLFLAVMWAVFQLTTRAAAPLQEGLTSLFTGPVSRLMGSLVAALGLQDTWVAGFAVDGVVAGVGMLLTFVPLMAIMFALLALLEDSGYLARAAVVTDRLMRLTGLPGKAFLPLVVGFGCNVPAVSATRILPDARQRLLTVLLVPFTSCSARLTVYVLVATTFFGSRAGTVVFGMYVLSIALVVLAGLLLRSTLVRAVGNDPLVLDLPAYQVPMPRQLLATTWTRVAAFLRTASGIVLATVVVVWLLSATPTSPGHGTFGDVPVSESAFGAVSAAVAPAFVPAGFGDWHASGALVVGFVAKEAVVSSWAQTYATQEPADVHAPGLLGASLRADFERSSRGHVTPAVMAFLVFLLGYTPCVATLAAQRREVGMRWTAIGVLVQLALAWTLAVAVFQVGRLLS